MRLYAKAQFQYRKPNRPYRSVAKKTPRLHSPPTTPHTAGIPAGLRRRSSSGSGVFFSTPLAPGQKKSHNPSRPHFFHRFHPWHAVCEKANIVPTFLCHGKEWQKKAREFAAKKNGGNRADAVARHYSLGASTLSASVA